MATSTTKLANGRRIEAQPIVGQRSEVSQRRQLAVVRALLDDVERATASGTPELDFTRGEQLVEELAGLGRRILECAEAMKGEARPRLSGSAGNGSGGPTTGPARGGSRRISLRIAGRRV